MTADKGNQNAMHIFAMILYQGDGVSVNKKEAANYFKKAADNGVSTAMFCYAEMIHNGEDFDENRPEAARYYKLVADNKNILAYVTILSNDGIKADKKLAAKYFKMAKECSK